MRAMQDAVTPANINPADVQLVAGYLNGRYAWSQADWARFPNAVHVGISVRAAWTVGHVLDVETGDATPAEAPGWVQARRAAGADPTVYCNSSTWPAVRAAFAAARVAEPHYWIARYDGDPTIPAGAVAKQYRNTPGYDLSVVADYWPGVDNPQEDDMQLSDTVNMWKGHNPATYTVEQCLASAVGWAETLGGRLDTANTAIGNLAQLVMRGADVDEVALAKALEPVATAAITAALEGAAPGTPEENAQATIAAFRALLGTAPTTGA